MSKASLAHYAREIERLWSRFLERPAVLSPGDWRWISEWHGRGIPLELIAECIEAAVERRRKGRGPKDPRGLAYLAPGIEEAWSVIVDGRTSPACEPGKGTAGMAPASLAAWRWRMDQEPPGSGLGLLLRSLVAEIDRGADLARIDAALDRGLPETVEPSVLQAAENKAQARLMRFRSRLTAEQLDAALRRAVTQRLRRTLQLPRLEAVAPPED